MSLRLFWGSIKELCQVSVHREGVNPSSMDGVPDLRDHNSSCYPTFVIVELESWEMD